MADDIFQIIAFCVIFGIAGIMIELAFFKGVHFQPHTWAKIGIGVILLGCGGYFWWARK
jgi:hypothetical protein